MITRWSFSRSLIYDQCPRRAELAYSLCKPETPRPDGNKAAVRGSRIHQNAEDFVLKRTDKLIPELFGFGEELKHVRDVICKTAEQTWYFDKDWTFTTSESNRWLTVIIDLMTWITPTEAVVTDYKSGKRFGNEIKHAKQTQLYMLAAFLKFPQLEKIHAELWYTDLNELVRQTFTRTQGMRFFDFWNNKGTEITQEVIFEPNPTVSTCKFCPYKSGMNKWVIGTGDCDLNPPDPHDLPEEQWRDTLARNIQKAAPAL